jgi:hypothetical protein
MSHAIPKWAAAGIIAALLIASDARAAQDKIILKAGAPVTGEILAFNAQANTVTLRTAQGEIPYPMANIARVELAERPAAAEGIAAAAEERYAEAVEKLRPLVDKFLGLDAPWVPQAASVLADALAQTGKTFESEKLAEAILKAYPNSVFRFQGMIAKASSLIAAKQLDQAMAVLDEVEKAFPPSAAPDRRTLQILSNLYFSKGQIYKAKGDKARAFESFLTVAALYYEPAKRAAQALAEAEALKKEDPSLVIN